MKTPEQAFDEWVNQFDTESNKYQDMGADEYFIAGYKAALAAAPTPPAQEDEPVAHINRVELFGVHVTADLNSLGEELPDDTPLYTRPQSDSLRKAAEALVKFISGNIREAVELDRLGCNLRAALKEGK